jgi:hypothetical protein
MAMELEFYRADGSNGEVMLSAHKVTAASRLGVIKRYRSPDCVYIILRHTSRHRGAWIIWVRQGYDSGTHPTVGPIV